MSDTLDVQPRAADNTKVEERGLLFTASVVTDRLRAVVEAAEREYGDDRKELHVSTRTGLHRLEVPGMGRTAEEYRRTAIERALLGLSETLSTESLLEPLARGDLHLALEDPLSSTTRTTRRNLVASSGAALVVGLSGKLPPKIPGFDIKLEANQGLLVLGALLGLVLYQGAAFHLYARADRTRRNSLERSTADVSKKLEVALVTIETEAGRAKEVAPPELWARDAEGRLREFLAFARKEVVTYRRERRVGFSRGLWDFVLPWMLAVVALLALAYAAWRGVF